MASIQDQVLVVGAGPTGLALAVELARLGVSCRVVDKDREPCSLSRALGLQARTLEIFERLGIAEEVIAAGRKVHGISTYSEGKRIVHVGFDQIESRHNYVVILPQADTERLLAKRLAALGVEVERCRQLVGIIQEDAGVEAQIAAPDSSHAECARFSWVVGCDGAHSTVRHLLDVPFEGKAFEEAFCLADLHIDGNVPDDEMTAHLSRGSILAFFPMPGNRRFRMIFQKHGEVLPKNDPCVAEFQSAIDAFGPKGCHVSEPTWMARFHISQRQVRNYQRNRVFLAGDAAHMNTGIQDACNLAWKLALVASGRSKESLLDSYEAERKPVGASLLRATGAATKVLLRRNPVAEAVRDRMAGLLTSFEAVQDKIRSNVSELAINYRHSPIVEQHPNGRLGELLSSGHFHASGPHAGDRAPDGMIRRKPDGEEIRLFDLLKWSRHTLLFFAGRKAHKEVDQRQREVLEIAQGSKDLIDYYIVLSASREPTDALGNASTLFDQEGRLLHAYAGEEEALYLIRPDGYIGFRSQPANGEAVRAYLNRTFM
jgi:2-polyprenyl-6-methoxyphenol hydroxylase-like FAD-dependent oxidoreductase